MTEQIVIVHDFECSEQAFWNTFLNNDYNKEMFIESMKFARWEVLKFDVSDLTADRIIEVEPRVGELPGPIKKVVGDKVGYREEGRLDRSQNCYELRITPGMLASKISVSGRQYTKPDGDHRCQRIFEATVEVRLFGVGSLIEKHIIRDMQKGYDAGAEFTRGYMERHGIR